MKVLPPKILLIRLSSLGDVVLATAAVEALPERLKEAFLLRRYGELSYEQVADSLGINISAAKMRVSRALDFIEEYLGEYLDVRRREARVSRRTGVVG